MRRVAQEDRQQRREEAVQQREEAALGGLAQLETARRGRIAPPGIQILPGQAAMNFPAEGGFAPEAGEPGGAGAFAPAVPPRSVGGLFPPMPPALVEGISPEMLAQIVAHPAGRAGLDTLQRTEDQTEKRRLQNEARQLETVAKARLAADDLVGATDELAKMWTRLGQYGQAGEMTERSLKLRSDAKEATQAKKDWIRVREAVEAYETAPSTTSWLDIQRAIGESESVVVQAMGTDLLKGRVKDTASKSPWWPILRHKLTQKQLAAGLAWDAEQAIREVDEENPGLLMRVATEEIDGKKEIDKLIFKRWGVREDIDPKLIKDPFLADALMLARQRLGRPVTSEDMPTITEAADARRKQVKRLEAEADPLKQELGQLNKDLKEHQLKVARGEVPMTVQQISLEVQRVQRVRKEAIDSGDPALAEQAKALERDWIGQEAEAIRQRGGKVPKLKASVADRLLAGKKIQTLAPEEQEAVVLDIAQRLFPGKVRTAQDLAGLKKGGRERQAIQAEITRLERLSEAETD